MWWRCETPAPLPAASGPYGPRNIWYGVHPTYEIPDRNRANEDMYSRYLRSQQHLIGTINCLYAEFDGKDFGGKEKTSDHILSLALHPSVIIDSGGGYHTYWLLKAPWQLKSWKIRKEAMQLQHDWVEYTGGDIVSSNLNRVLRIPGFRNHKSRYAPDFPTVSFVQCDMGRMYSLEDFRTVVAASKVAHKVEDGGTGGPEDAFVWMMLGQAMKRPLHEGIEVYKDVSKRQEAQKLAQKVAGLERRFNAFSGEHLE